MRISSALFAAIIVLLVMGAIILSFISGTQNKEALSSAITTPTPGSDTAPQPPAPAHNDLSDKITVSVPLPNTKVTSPLEITGSARGTWYFEASFPIRLEGEDGTLIAETQGHAEGEWMTENFVPFTATLTWASTTVQTGTLILKRDNPSGLPENDAEIRIPVTF